MDPWPWQSNILATLLTQKVGKPHLLVRPTGGGKSMIRDVFASTRPGSIVLSLAPLLSLSKDQTTKLETKARTNKLVSIHLDEYRSDCQVASVMARIPLIPQSDASLVLFASPQVLETKYRALLKMLLEERLLSMVCVDEVHLMVQFGLRFRAEFLRLKTLLFLPLAIASSSTDAVNNQNRETRLPTLTSVPILFMTATADHVMLQQLERITGYCFDQSNLFWPSAGDMQQRRQQLRYMPTTMVSSILRPLTKSCFVEGGSMKKFIVYGNSRRQVEQSHASYRKWMDAEAIDKDVILIVGTQSLL